MNLAFNFTILILGFYVTGSLNFSEKASNVSDDHLKINWSFSRSKRDADSLYRLSAGRTTIVVPIGRDPNSGNWSQDPEEEDNTRLDLDNDGHLQVPWIKSAPVCVINLGLATLCSGVLLRSQFILTAAGCIAGVTPLFKKKDTGYRTSCGSPIDFQNSEKTRYVLKYFSMPGYNLLNMSQLRRHDIGLIEVDNPYYAQKGTTVTRLNLPRWPNYSIKKRNTELVVYYTTCKIYYKNRDQVANNNVDMVEALVISREECAKRDMFAQEDEFCLLIASYRNGAKNMLVGAPVICKGTLEGILILSDPETFKKPNRTFLASRVDNYFDFIYNVIKLPGAPFTDAPEGPVTAAEDDEGIKFIVAGIRLKLWMLYATFGWCFCILMVGLIAFVIYACHCEKFRRLNPRHRRQCEADFTLSVNLLVPLYILGSRIVLYLRLRDTIERQVMHRRLLKENNPVVLHPSDIDCA